MSQNQISRIHIVQYIVKFDAHCKAGASENANIVNSQKGEKPYALKCTHAKNGMDHKYIEKLFISIQVVFWVDVTAMPSQVFHPPQVREVG
jgi:hypothetical protein